ncbi:Glycosyltransferase involved in cell wall bisynthesis [Aliiroseovarius halocynthiae]|uniref:Glycosyltransferase family 4 protein n=1 Tax=Aliiroseovarius halocynthiae TaxID=985055 RepID=A0A545SUJ8_9RHOB|nr:glycosyltransferase family 4 protein [Aliiroseovarius halocynthiae]TQV68649.1 glycosyltransferase family 4 protein [Aliiroseovarius halocynthiae]SMR71069.1 Glycosyltransferase involved in cell wall bisynthesis [Aliiroseovarius halocynthiae]
MRAPKKTHDATAASAPKKAVVLGSLGWSLVNFRLDLIRRLAANGYEVLAVAADIDDETARTLRDIGVRPCPIYMDRTGTNPLRDLKTLWELVRFFRREKPELVISYTMKPNIYGSLAAQIAGVPHRYALFTGLGYSFMEENPSGRRKRVRDLSILLHRIALRRIHGAFCYNSADRRDIRRFHLIPDRVPLHDVPGSGVDTRRYFDTPIPTGRTRFLFVGRLLRSKGLLTLGKAAEILRAQGHECDIDILGPADSNPDAIDPALFAGWQKRGLVNWLGETRDVRPYLAKCSVFVLPTELREGVPRSILEAMSSGRAVITTDAPGCGEATQDGVSGLVFPQGDADALAQTMKIFINEPWLAVKMGKAARVHACQRFDVHLVNSILMQHMGVEPLTPEARLPKGLEFAELAS